MFVQVLLWEYFAARASYLFHWACIGMDQLVDAVYCLFTQRADHFHLRGVFQVVLGCDKDHLQGVFQVVLGCDKVKLIIAHKAFFLDGGQNFIRKDISTELYYQLAAHNTRNRSCRLLKHLATLPTECVTTWSGHLSVDNRLRAARRKSE